MVLALCLTAILSILLSCGSEGANASDQSKSPLIGTRTAQKKGVSDYTINADGTGYPQRGEMIEKMISADKGDAPLK